MPCVVCNIYVLQTAFKHEHCAHSFPMGEDGKERCLVDVVGVGCRVHGRLLSAVLVCVKGGLCIGCG